MTVLVTVLAILILLTVLAFPFLVGNRVALSHR